MSPTLDIADARIAVVDPDTPAVILQDIAAHHPTLWSLVAGHPNTSPQVLAWLQRVGDESVLNALSARESAMPFDQFMEISEPIESPPEPTYTEPPPTYTEPPPTYQAPPPTYAPPTAYMPPPMAGPAPTPPVQPAPPPMPAAPPVQPPPFVPPQQFIPAPQPAFIPAPQPAYIPPPQQFVAPPPVAPPQAAPPQAAPPPAPTAPMPPPRDYQTTPIAPVTHPGTRAKRGSAQSESESYATAKADKRQTPASRNRMIVLVIVLVMAILAGSGWLIYHASATNDVPPPTSAPTAPGANSRPQDGISHPTVSLPWITDVTDDSFNINVSVTNPSGVEYQLCINNAGKMLACWGQITANFREFQTPVDGDFRTYPMDPTVELTFS